MQLAELPELDVYAPEFLADPHPAIDEIRGASAMARSERGVELLTYGLCEQVMRDEALAVGFDEMMEATGITDGPAFDMIVASINNAEGPDHSSLRKAIMPFLVPSRIEKLREGLRRTVTRRLEDVADDRSCDIVETVARWLPATAFCLMTGAPLEDRELIWRLSDQAQRFFEMKPLNRTAVEEGLDEVIDYMSELLEQRRRRPGDDVLSHLISQEAEGTLTPAEVENLAVILLAASTDTTAGQITFTIAALASSPEAFARVRDEETLIANAVLETARHRPALWTAPRFARDGTSLEGVELAPGTVINAMFLAANRDPSVFDDPGRLDVERKLTRPPLNWSSGRHFCPGRSLAVLEIQEAVRATARAWQSCELASPPVTHGAPYIVAPISAEVRFEPATRTGG